MESTNITSMKGISVVIMAVAALFVFSPTTRAATISPAPDGGYPGNNTAEGTLALIHDTSGINNTAAGFRAMFKNTTGSWNQADGAFTLYNNSSGIFNTGEGFAVLASNTTGTHNTALGAGALHSNVLGSYNTALGFLAGSQTNGTANILIGNLGVAGESGIIHIGTKNTHKKAFIAGVADQTITAPPAVPVEPVCVNTGSGQIGMCPPAPSSARFKDDIQPMDKQSEAILSLKPVTFRYKPEIEPTSEVQFGLVAEEVAKVNPDLVKYRDGKIFGVRYEAVNAMLLNEFLKEHQRVQEQAAKIAEQEKAIKTLTASVKDQAAQIEKVSGEITVMNTKPQLVNRDE